jgi:hypothetical protein
MMTLPRSSLPSGAWMGADAVECLRMESRGLQNRCGGGFPSPGGFDPLALPPGNGLINGLLAGSVRGLLNS